LALIHTPISGDVPELLLVLDKVLPSLERRKHEKTQWRVPGGKIHPGETPRDTMLREFFEETNIGMPSIIFVADGKSLPHARPRDGRGTGSLMHVALTFERPEPDPYFHTDEIMAVRWFKINTLPLPSDSFSLGYGMDPYNLRQVREVCAENREYLRGSVSSVHFQQFVQSP